MVAIFCKVLKHHSHILLLYSRRVNLFLQGRRLSDHYRFASPSEYWISTSIATTAPGEFFPITISEIQANPNIQ